jgi:hypothetical protein
MTKQGEKTLVQAILFMAVVSFFLGKAALNGEPTAAAPEPDERDRKKAA